MVRGYSYKPDQTSYGHRLMYQKLVLMCFYGLLPSVDM